VITVLPFAREHVSSLEPQEGQRVELVSRVRPAVLEQGWSFSVIDEQARVIMCAGAIPDETGMWWGWALLSVHARRRMVALSRAVLTIMRATPTDVVRIAVRWEFKQGHEWARMLGFTPLREVRRLDGIWCAVYERSVRCGA